MAKVEKNITAIKDHIANGTPLDPAQELHYRRIEIAYSLVQKFKVKSQVKRILRNFKDKDGNSLFTSDTMAYRAIKEAETSFAPITKYNKELQRSAIIEHCLKDIDEADGLAKIALAKKDYDLYKLAKSLKEKAMKIWADASGVKTEDPDMPDFSKMEANIYNIHLDNFTLNQMNLRMAGKQEVGGLIDLDEFSQALPAHKKSDKS